MASTRPRTCGECAYLERTSAEQVFLKCRFWCGSMCTTFGAERMMGCNYAVTHCHMQPSATACRWWLRKENWREQVKKEKLERKLRKRAKKLARFAHENGIEHIDLFAIDHPEDGVTFYSAVLFGDNDPDVDVSGFVGGEADA